MSILKKNFQKKSDNVVNVFKKTVNDLTQLNAEINKENLKKVEEIAKLEQESEDLIILSVSNTKIIDKINQFLN